MLDNVFLAEPVDSYYKTRREHGTIVTLACTRPEETCFCGTFGIDAAEPGRRRALPGWTEDALYLEAKTEKGEAAAGDALRITADRGRGRGRG